MQKYQSHKVVEAGKIINITQIVSKEIFTYSLHLDGEEGERVMVSEGWVSKHNPIVGGYFVQYSDDYQSYSPAEAFEAGYTKSSAMSSREVIREAIIRPGTIMSGGPKRSFGVALHAMRDGKRVAREGWNGKEMFIFLVDGSTFKVNRPPLNKFYEEGTEVNYHPHVDMKTADGNIVPWLCSQTDMLAEDWLIIE